MKISVLKKLIKEAVREVVREEMVLLEKKLTSGSVIKENSLSGLSEIKRKFSQSQPSSQQYDDLTPKAPAGNPKKIMENGEVFVSGKNVMDWYDQSKTEQVMNEHENALRKMEKTDAFVRDTISRKRI